MSLNHRLRKLVDLTANCAAKLAMSPVPQMYWYTIFSSGLLKFLPLTAPFVIMFSQISNRIFCEASSSPVKNFCRILWQLVACMVFADGNSFTANYNNCYERIRCNLVEVDASIMLNTRKSFALMRASPKV